MEQLINFINNRLQMASKTPQSAYEFHHQAFGALMFFIEVNALDYTEYRTLELLWENTYRPAFEAIIYAPREEHKTTTEWRSKPGNPFI